MIGHENPLPAYAVLAATLRGGATKLVGSFVSRVRANDLAIGDAGCGRALESIIVGCQFDDLRLQSRRLENLKHFTHNFSGTKNTSRLRNLSDHIPASVATSTWNRNDTTCAGIGNSATERK